MRRCAAGASRAGSSPPHRTAVLHFRILSLSLSSTSTTVMLSTTKRNETLGENNVLTGNAASNPSPKSRIPYIVVRKQPSRIAAFVFGFRYSRGFGRIILGGTGRWTVFWTSAQPYIIDCFTPKTMACFGGQNNLVMVRGLFCFRQNNLVMVRGGVGVQKKNLPGHHHDGRKLVEVVVEEVSRKRWESRRRSRKRWDKIVEVVVSDEF